ncbi:MAG: transcription antitermination factor NusB [Oscillospiraceae bacterium]|nr:transcription antitermination factor NusB [Oscillospiraceae bacterium]
MSTRHEIRDSAMKLLYESSLRDDPMIALYALAEEIDEIIVNEDVRALVDGTLLHMEKLDGYIQKYSPKRALSRIPKLELSILRLAMFEILYDDKTPANAAVSEAVNLMQEYSYYQEDVQFINGLLGNFVRDQNTEQQAEQ